MEKETNKTVDEYRMQLYCDIYKVAVMAQASKYKDRPHEFAAVAVMMFDEFFSDIESERKQHYRKKMEEKLPKTLQDAQMNEVLDD